MKYFSPGQSHLPNSFPTTPIRPLRVSEVDFQGLQAGRRSLRSHRSQHSGPGRPLPEPALWPSHRSPAVPPSERSARPPARPQKFLPASNAPGGPEALFAIREKYLGPSARVREAGRPAGSQECEPRSGKHKARVPANAGATQGAGARTRAESRAGWWEWGRGEEAKAGRGRPGVQPSPGRASTPRGRGEARRGRARGLGRRGRGAGESVPGPRPCFPLFLPPPTGRSCGAAPLAGPPEPPPASSARGEPVNPRTTRSSIWAMDG